MYIDALVIEDWASAQPAWHFERCREARTGSQSLPINGIVGEVLKDLSPCNVQTKVKVTKRNSIPFLAKVNVSHPGVPDGNSGFADC